MTNALLRLVWCNYIVIIITNELHEQGQSNPPVFVHKMSSTQFEHSNYYSLLESYSKIFRSHRIPHSGHQNYPHHTSRLGGQLIEGCQRQKSLPAQVSLRIYNPSLLTLTESTFQH